MTSGDRAQFPADSPDEYTGYMNFAGLPPHDFGIDKRVKGSRVNRVSDSVTVRSDTFHFSDGYVHDVLIYRPDDQLYDVGISMGIPLGTEIGIGLKPGGFNDEVAKGLAQDGNVVVLSSQNRASLIRSMLTLGGVILDKDRGPEALTILSHDSYAQCLVLDAIEQNDALTTERKSVQVGYSRGAMLGFGVLAYGATTKFDRDIVYTDALDPCLEHSVGPRPNKIKDVPYFLREISSLIGSMIDNPDDARLLHATFPLSASRLYQQITSGVDLFRGSAGPLARHVPANTLMTMRMFDGSILNNSDDWERIFNRRKYPRVYASREDGLHLTGVKPIIRNETKRRVSNFQELVNSGVDPHSIQPEDILNLPS